ncbi:hypothetical protein C9374_005313 [Naegleria lovaniensis]|uniref:EamA domain-containing protein n=1 Tax=Naegleria lovaniensis TaxID=51637 RepID=A0AA88GQK9_NAELO|nr:uncharacterized protein C9374_005313 [Naegleria lovaniensis]KAG2382733.1 hypothetical protein C9374_005313 [Naegleria lovaniensis]
MDDDACSFQRHSQDEEHHTHHFYQAHWYSTSPQAIWKHMTDAGTTLLPHILLTSNLILFAGFFLLSPHAMKILRPIIFGVFRIAIMIVCMLPLMLYFDRKYSFRSEKSLRRRREAYLSTLSATKESCNFVIYVCYSLWYYLFYTKFFDSILRKLPKKKQAKILALCGFIIIMNQITFLSGYYLTNATVSGSMSPLTAVITCSLSMLIGNEPKSWLKLFGVVTSVCGAIAMVLTTALLKQHSFSAIYSEITSEDPLHHYWNPYHPGAFSQSSTSSVTFVLGVFCLMLSTLANSLYLLLQKKLLNKGVPPISVTFWSFFFGYGILVIVGFFFLPISWRRIDWMSILGLFYAGCPFGAFQFVFQTKASSMTTPTMVGIYSTMSPMVGLVTGLAFLGEKTSPFVLFGGSFIIIGVVFVLFARWRETHTKQQKLFSLEPNGNITMKQDGSNMVSVSSGESLSSSTNQILLSSKNERSTTTSNSTCSQNLSAHEEAIHSKV